MTRGKSVNGDLRGSPRWQTSRKIVGVSEDAWDFLQNRMADIAGGDALYNMLHGHLRGDA